VKPLPIRLAWKIYSVLVEHVNAPEDERHLFLQVQTKIATDEWWFCGSLGPTGRLCREDNRLWVECRPEDIDGDRYLLMERTNFILQMMFDGYLEQERTKKTEA
jgi:hypothetical protein